MILCIVGIENVAGDMFTSVPKGEAIFMKVSLFESFINSRGLTEKLT